MSKRSSRRKPYHHGDLRAALVEAAAALLAESGQPALSLRAVALRAGVSHAAAYHHFDSREALLSAVAAHGFRRLYAQLSGAARGASSALDAFGRLGKEYIRFAAGHPALYRLMFGSVAGERSADSELRAAADQTFDTLVSALADCQRAGQARAGDARTLALTAWSTVHGFSSLLLDSQLADGARSAPDVLDTLYRGLARP